APVCLGWWLRFAPFPAAKDEPKGPAPSAVEQLLPPPELRPIITRVAISNDQTTMTSEGCNFTLLRWKIPSVFVGKRGQNLQGSGAQRHCLCPRLAIRQEGCTSLE